MSELEMPMTLGNMRANGVRELAAWCLGRGSFSRNEAPTAQLYYTGSMMARTPAASHNR
jgi:hypothetical protein